MKRIFEKHETLFSLLLIVIYIILNSLFDVFNYKTTILNFLLAMVIIIFILKNELLKYFALDKIPKPNKKNLFFIPLFMIMSINLWNGINISNSPSEIIFYMLTMILVGFLEEIIFRGFLYQMMAKENVKMAVVVTSITFGVGHIINLLNGASFIPTLLQICYATTTGYLFVIILQKEKSLWPQIITHSVINALSIFNGNNNLLQWITAIFLIGVTSSYAYYLNKKNY